MFDFRSEYNDLAEELGGSAKFNRRRGFKLEKIIRAMLDEEQLEPRASYKIKGEQLDDSLFYCGQTFLLEAKWHKDKLPVSSIYEFKGKLDGKFHTSSGVFISIGGYGEDVTDALRFGKSQNILLFDKTDMEYIMYKGVKFTEVLKYKLRQAGDTGNPYIPYSIIVKDIEASSKDPSLLKYEFLVACEGKSDIAWIKELFSEFETKNPNWKFTIVAFDGVQGIVKNLPTKILEIATSRNHNIQGVIAFFDSDNAGKLGAYLLKETIEKSAVSFPLQVFNVSEGTLNNSDDKLISDTVNKIEDFITGIVGYDFDVETAAAEARIRELLENAEWDVKKREVTITDISSASKYDTSRVFRNIDDLRYYLNEEADIAAGDEVLFHDKDYVDALLPFDFSDLVAQYLEKYEENFNKMKWKL